MRLDPPGEVGGERAVAPDHGGEAVGAVRPQHPPQLQRAEPAAEGDAPVAVVDDLARLAGGVAQVLGHDRHRPGEAVAVGDVEHVAVHARPQPLVRVEAVAVGRVEAVGDERSQLGHGPAAPRHGGVDVVPHARAAGDGAGTGDGVDGQERRSSRRSSRRGTAGARRRRRASIAAAEGVDPQAALGVDVDQAQLRRRQAGEAEALLDRRVGIGARVGAEAGDARPGRRRWPPRGRRRWRRRSRSTPRPGSRRRRSTSSGTTPGRPSRSTSQSHTWASSSVVTGDVAHSIPCWPSGGGASSPSTAAGDELPGK